MRAVFEAPTIAGLAEKIRQSPPMAPATIGRRPSHRQQVRQLLEHIEELSGAEIESLLSPPR